MRLPRYAIAEKMRPASQYCLNGVLRVLWDRGRLVSKLVHRFVHLGSAETAISTTIP